MHHESLKNNLPLMAIGGCILGGVTSIVSFARIVSLIVTDEIGETPLIPLSFEISGAPFMALTVMIAAVILCIGSSRIGKGERDNEKQLITPPFLYLSCALFAISSIIMLASHDNDVGKIVAGTVMLFSGLYTAALASGPSLVNRSAKPIL